MIRTMFLLFGVWACILAFRTEPMLHAGVLGGIGGCLLAIYDIQCGVRIENRLNQMVMLRGSKVAARGGVS